MKASTLLKTGAALVLVTVLGAVGAIAYLNHTRPQPLGLAQAAGHTASPRLDDPLTLACRPPAIPDNSSSGVAGLWAVQAGSIAGYQAHEKFAEVPSPHVAVARTDAVGGWLLISTVPAGVQIETGCVAVDVRTLRSVDELPGFRTSDRDDVARQMLGSREHPYVIFQPYPATVLVDASSSAVQHTQISGALQIGGVTRPAKFGLDVRLKGSELSAAGATVVAVGDYGVEVPREAGGFVQVDPNITLEVSLVLTKPAQPQ